MMIKTNMNIGMNLENKNLNINTDKEMVKMITLNNTERVENKKVKVESKIDKTYQDFKGLNYLIIGNMYTNEELHPIMKEISLYDISFKVRKQIARKDYELFVPVRGFEDRYTISNKGRIYSIRTKRFLTYSITNKGYKKVSLSLKGEEHTKTEHGLLADNFIFPDYTNQKLVVNHIDENRLNNSINNLEVITRQANWKHSYETFSNYYVPETEEEKQEIKDLYFKYNKSLTEIHREKNMSFHVITQIIKED